MASALARGPAPSRVPSTAAALDSPCPTLQWETVEHTGLSVLPAWPGSGPEPTWMEPAPFCCWDLSPGVLAGSGADGKGSPYLLGSVFPSGASPSQAGLGLEVPGACSPLPGSKLKWFRL
ncbi:hypothetical protein H8959_013729 [Pygathrix nigripes]